jgi:putative NIF3 family GTP cyclohydrolase 1 type 2
MNTKQMMDIALELAGLAEIPADSGIQVEGENLNKVLIGIDMDTPELLLAKQLGYDCVVSHHPKAEGSTVNFSKVMDVQIDTMMSFGVPINKAQKMLRKKQNSVELGGHVGNYDRHASSARLLEMPYMNIHLPADIITEGIVQKHINKKIENNAKATLSDVVDALNDMKIYKDALAGPVIRVGGPKDYAGKVAVLMAGGTNGGADVFKAYFEAGVGTIVCMHVPEDVKKAVAEQNIGNVIVAGHMASDSIGLNVIIDAWKKAGLEVTKMSGIL